MCEHPAQMQGDAADTAAELEDDRKFRWRAADPRQGRQQNLQIIGAAVVEPLLLPGHVFRQIFGAGQY